MPRTLFLSFEMMYFYPPEIMAKTSHLSISVFSVSHLILSLTRIYLIPLPKPSHPDPLSVLTPYARRACDHIITFCSSSEQDEDEDEAMNQKLSDELYGMSNDDDIKLLATIQKHFFNSGIEMWWEKNSPEFQHFMTSQTSSAGPCHAAFGRVLQSQNVHTNSLNIEQLFLNWVKLIVRRRSE